MCETGSKNFLKLLAVHFYCLMQVPQGTGPVQLLSIGAGLEPFPSSGQRGPALFGMQGSVQRALTLSLFCTSSVLAVFGHLSMHTPVTQPCASRSSVSYSSLAGVECEPRSPLVQHALVQ